MLPGLRGMLVRRRPKSVAAVSRYPGYGSGATYVGDNRVLVRVVAGRRVLAFYVHADDRLLSPWLIVNGHYEPELTAFFAEELRPDSHGIDVGCNFGFFACLMARLAPRGRVIGIEPNAPVHALAVDNVLINALHERCEVLHAAASDRAGTLTLFRRQGRAGNTSIAAMGEDFTRSMREAPEQPFQVPAVRIDDLRDRLGGRVDFIKIDVEGAEPLVLAGARETIAANPRLRIAVEWSPGQIRHAGHDIAEFVRDIAATGLRAFQLRARRPRPIGSEELLALPYQSGILLRRPTD